MTPSPSEIEEAVAHYHGKGWFWIVLAALGCVPWLVFAILTLAGVPHPLHPEEHPLIVAFLTGTAILSAAFLLSWGAEVAQVDIAQSFAVALLALIAILPEYSVDMYFSYQAGRYPGSDYAHYAVANMTGANRLLIGVAWTAIMIVHWLRSRQRSIVIEPGRKLELFVLAVATVYSFLLPLKETISLIDTVFLIGIFIWYLGRAVKSERVEPELMGPPVVVAGLAKNRRRLTTALMFLFSAGVILASAEPFSESLVAAGETFSISPFFLVQWVAPLASEAPEFIIAGLFAYRGMASLAMAAMVSSKINQWTLLVGLIPAVYSLGAGRLAALPLDHVQVHELLLTSAQSLLAVVLLADLRFTLRKAGLLAVLFFAQMITQILLPEDEALRSWFSATYVAIAVIAAVMMWRGRRPAAIMN